MQKTQVETVAQKAKRLLEPIPEHEFITGEFTDQKGRCCAIGHYMRLTSDNPKDYSLKTCSDKGEFGFTMGTSPLRLKSTEFITEKHGRESTSIAEVNNDNDINGYNESYVKARVMHLLDDMIEAGY